MMLFVDPAMRKDCFLDNYICIDFQIGEISGSGHVGLKTSYKVKMPYHGIHFESKVCRLFIFVPTVHIFLIALHIYSGVMILAGQEENDSCVHWVCIGAR